MSVFEALGGEPGVRRLVDAFYDHMRAEPMMLPLLELHPDLERARERLFQFLVGWTGGPPLYVSQHGPPRLRARHLHVPIDAHLAALWMACMAQALDATVADPHTRRVLRANFTPLADHLRNA